MQQDNRTAVITGASRGLGAGMARELARRGFRLGLCAREESDVSGSEHAVAERFDIADPEATERFARRVEERFGTIHLWINNAGVLEPIMPLRDIESREYSRHLEVNVLGVFHGTGAYVRHLRRVGEGGVLVNVSSGAGRRGYAGWSAYCAAKAAVDRMTECVALEERDHGLRAYAVAPGIIDTDMQALIRETPRERFPLVDRFLELKRQNAFTTPERVAAELLALAFDPAYATDEVLVDLRT
jgi:benzil reductase ((S)-benzoin forming)